MKIIMENVSAGYSKNNHILDNISLNINEGGICGILGPNGSGKTTLLRVLSGILPYEGELKLCLDSSKTIDINISPRKLLAHYIAMTPQFSSTYFSYNVYDTIMMGRYAHIGSSIKDILGGISKEDKEIVDFYIEKLGLKDFTDKSISELSGGQLERVLLARTFVQETPIILLDEPTNHLDIRYQSELINHLKDWVKKTTTVDNVTYKNTIISVFHDVQMAAYLSDELILMKNGQIIKKAPVNEVINRELLQEAYDTDVMGFINSIKLSV